jgi:AraC family transcriptional regulator, melibiose operon regulatory protein
MIPFSFYSELERDNKKLNSGLEVVTFEKQLINIFSAEVKYCEAHWHAAPELIFVLKGQFTILLDGVKKVLRSGGFLYISKNRIHSLKADVEDSRLLTIQFSMQLFTIPHNNLNGEYYISSSAGYNSNDRDVWVAMVKLAQEFTPNHSHSIFKIISLTYELLYLLEKVSYSIENSTETVRDRDFELLKSCLNYIDEHYMDSLTLKQLSENSGLSYSYFSRLFKQVCGFNFKKYLTFIRISKTIPLLIDTKIPITEIALQCGFSEHKYLISAFHKFYDMTPTSFRKNYHAGDSAGLATPALISVPIEKALADFCTTQKIT